MSFKDSKEHYGRISRFNHWLGALIVIGMLSVGLYFSELPKGDERSYWLKLHVGFGGLVFLFLWFRVLWRMFSKSPVAILQKQMLSIVSKVTHWVMLLAVFTMAVSGPLLIWTRGADINVFDWFAIPTPIGKMPVLHEWMETIHELAAETLLVVIIIHVLPVIKHQFINKDQVLSRMVKFLRK